MPTERHMQELIDKSLAGAASFEEEQSLRAHLATCAACSEYLGVSNRAIGGLDGFRFEVDPALESKVLASLAVRAQQLEAKHTQRGRVWGTCLLAIALTVAGSFVVSQLGGLAASAFHIQPAQLQVGVTAFWILPSFLVCVLFLLLPASLTSRANEKGLSL